MKIDNISQKPKRFYGRHFAPGVVNYPEHEKMLYISPEIARSMDESFTGCPLFVEHVDEVNMETVHSESDGWVIRSFYEPLDGSHWVEFFVVSDEAHQKIKDGWKLSNSYIIDDYGPGGYWHNVEYEMEITKAAYNHLSLVDNPRYEESIILTPEEFKAHQAKLRGDIESVKNSKGDTKMSFFKKEKVTKLDNEKDIAALSVVLPKSKREATITQLMNEVDEMEVAKADTSAKYASDSDLVKIGDEEISVADLVAKITELMSAIEDAPADDEETIEVDAIDNADDDKKEEKKDEKKDKKDNSKSALSLLTAAKKPLPSVTNEAPKRVSMKDQIAMGKERY